VSKKDRIDNPIRLKEYGIDDILAAMKLRPGQQGADIGSGTGVFTIEIAKKISAGKLFAVDVNREYMSLLEDKIKTHNIQNIETLYADDLDKNIKDESLNFIFICAVLHEIGDKREFLERYRRKLRADGHAYIVEFVGPRRFLSDDINANRTFIAPQETKGYLDVSGYVDIEVSMKNELVYMVSAKNNI
jgi:ubiquinone/menaquinone biosynthesis C-methylase UbiE